MKKLFSKTAMAAALSLLLAISARAAGTGSAKTNADNGTKQSTIEGVVAPDNVYDRQPFSFAAPEGAETTITVKTVTGTVVQSSSADEYGRVFLPSGLPAGLYMISGGGDRGARPLGKIEVQQRSADVLERSWEHPPQPMQLTKSFQTVKLNDRFSLPGQGFSPNCADMQVKLAGAGQAQSVPVLAATEDQLKLAPVRQMQPGLKQLTVTNPAAGQSTEPAQMLVWNAQANLDQRVLHNGGQTEFVVQVEPADLPIHIQARISGHGRFGGGRTDAEAITNRGRVTFPVYADQGSGDFKIDWELAPNQPGLMPETTNQHARTVSRDVQPVATTALAALNFWPDITNLADQEQRKKRCNCSAKIDKLELSDPQDTKDASSLTVPFIAEGTATVGHTLKDPVTLDWDLKAHASYYFEKDDGKGGWERAGDATTSKKFDGPADVVLDPKQTTHKAGKCDDGKITLTVKGKVKVSKVRDGSGKEDPLATLVAGAKDGKPLRLNIVVTLEGTFICDPCGTEKKSPSKIYVVTVDKDDNYKVATK